MKGVFVHKQLEYRIEVPQDRLVQGDALTCIFSVKNHAATALPLDLSLQLAEGELKAVRQKEADAFRILQSCESLTTPALAPQATFSYEWRLKLDLNCVISDNRRSLFIRYGSPSGQIAELPLTVALHPTTEKLLHIFETSFQFARKGEHSSKGRVEAKLKPSSAPRFTMLDELVLGLRFDQTALLLEYQFRVKKFAAGSSVLNVSKGKSSLQQELSLERYWPESGVMDAPAIEAKISEALGTVVAGM